LSQAEQRPESPLLKAYRDSMLFKRLSIEHLNI